MALSACMRPGSTATKTDARDAPPETRSSTVSFAVFDKADILSECEDLEFSGVRSDATLDPEVIFQRIKAQVAGDKNRVPMRIGRPCATQFSDRTAFGVCVVGAEDKTIKFVARMSWYSFADVYENDSTMRECLSMRGTWDAVPRTSEQFRSAKLEHDLKAATKAFGAAARQ
jgi:hypothetical protein